MGLLLDSSIEDNIAVAAMKVDKKFVKRLGVFGQSDKKRIRAHANEMIRTLDIRCTMSRCKVSGCEFSTKSDEWFST